MDPSEEIWIKAELARLNRENGELLALCQVTLESIVDHIQRHHRGMCDGHIWKAISDLRHAIAKGSTPERCPKGGDSSQIRTV